MTKDAAISVSIAAGRERPARDNGMIESGQLASAKGQRERVQQIADELARAL